MHCHLLNIQSPVKGLTILNSLGIGKLPILRYRQHTSFDLEGDVMSPKLVALSVEWGFLPSPHTCSTFLACLADSSSSRTERGAKAPCPATPVLPMHMTHSNCKDISHANGE